MSELEAGHPNMTLLEALACGLPIVGTLESDLNGMEVVERDFQKGVAGLSKILNNYEAYQKAGLECAEKLSWKNRCLSLLEIFKSKKMNSLNIFKNKLDSSIKKLKKLDHDKDNKFLLDNNQYIDKQIKDIFDNINNNFLKINEELSTYPLSLCHGDLKSPNIFYKNNNEPYYLDFQYINLNKGISDIIFLLIESVDFDEDLYNNIIEYYYNIITSNGINYKYSNYIKDLKNSLSLFPFVVAVWFNTEDKNNLTDKNFPLNFLNKLMKYYKYEFKSTLI